MSKIFLLLSSPLSCSADLILSSLFGGKKKTAVSFATRSLSVANLLLLFISPDLILLTHFWLVSLSLFLSLFLSFFLSFFLYSKPSLGFSVSVVKVTDRFVKLRSLCSAFFCCVCWLGTSFYVLSLGKGFPSFFCVRLSVWLRFVCGADAKTHRRLPELVWTSTLASERSDFRVLISLCLDSRWFSCNLNVLVITIAEGRNITLEKCLSSLHRCSSSGEGRASPEQKARGDR
jgi:hypothetical protein